MSHKCHFYRKLKISEHHLLRKYEKLHATKEELKQKLAADKACAYYFSKSKAEFSDIVLLPYTYLLDYKFNRLALDLLRNAILVVDEGHNMLGAACDGASIEFSNESLHKLLKELDRLLELKSCPRRQVRKFMIFVQALGEFMESSRFLKIHSLSRNFPLSKVLGFFRECLDSGDTSVSRLREEWCPDDGISEFNMKEFLEVISSVIKYVTGKDFLELVQLRQKENMPYLSTKQINDHFKSFFELNDVLKNHKTKEQRASFVCQMQAENESRRIKIISLSPMWGLEKILKKSPHSMMVISGTLSPFRNFEAESGIKFPVTFSSPHVVSGRTQVD